MSESMHIVMVSFGPLGSTTTVTGARPPFAAANWSSWVCSCPDTIQSCGAAGLSRHQDQDGEQRRLRARVRRGQVDVGVAGGEAGHGPGYGRRQDLARAGRRAGPAVDDRRRGTRRGPLVGACQRADVALRTRERAQRRVLGEVDVDLRSGGEQHGEAAADGQDLPPDRRSDEVADDQHDGGGAEGDPERHHGGERLGEQAQPTGQQPVETQQRHEGDPGGDRDGDERGAPAPGQQDHQGDRPDDQDDDGNRPVDHRDVSHGSTGPPGSRCGGGPRN